jgi:hypothetical protein
MVFRISTNLKVVFCAQHYGDRGQKRKYSAIHFPEIPKISVTLNILLKGKVLQTAHRTLKRNFPDLDSRDLKLVEVGYTRVLGTVFTALIKKLEKWNP